MIWGEIHGEKAAQREKASTYVFSRVYWLWDSIWLILH